METKSLLGPRHSSFLFSFSGRVLLGLNTTPDPRPPLSPRGSVTLGHERKIEGRGTDLMNRTFHLPTLFFLLIVVIFVFVETTLRVEKVFDLCSDRVERVRSFLLIPGSSSVTLRKSPYHFLLLRTIRFSVHPVCSRGDTTPHPPDNRQDGAVHRQ